MPHRFWSAAPRFLARERWARALRRTWPTPEFRRCCWMVPAGRGQAKQAGAAAVDALTKAKPAAFYEPSLAELITPGNFEDDLPKLAGATG